MQADHDGVHFVAVARLDEIVHTLGRDLEGRVLQRLLTRGLCDGACQLVRRRQGIEPPPAKRDQGQAAANNPAHQTVWQHAGRSAIPVTGVDRAAHRVHRAAGRAGRSLIGSPGLT